MSIAKVENDKNLKSDFEGMTAYVIPHDPVANNEANSNKTGKHSVSDANIESMFGDRNKKDLDLNFYDNKECKTLSIDDKEVLKDWRLSHPDKFGQSKRKLQTPEKVEIINANARKETSMTAT